MRVLATAALAVGVTGLLGIGTEAPVATKGELDAIRLAVFQQQVAFWLDDHSRESETVVCLSIEERGARRSVPKEYLQRFSAEPGVRLHGDCEERAGGAVERATGRPAILLSVGRLSWQSADEVWVETRHFRSGVISGIRTQRVVREESGWACLGQIMKDGPL